MFARGTYFESPIGQDLDDSGYRHAFQYVALYIMAAQDNTSVSVKTKTGTDVVPPFTLHKGESMNVRVDDVGTQVTADKDVQLDILAGDLDSRYEMRWFSLLPTVRPHENSGPGLRTRLVLVILAHLRQHDP